MSVVAQKSSVTPSFPEVNMRPFSEFIRGGRLRKTSRGLVSFAPFLGVSALALGALLATTLPVEAGLCNNPADNTPQDQGRWICQSAANGSGTDFQQNIPGRANQNVNIFGTSRVNNVPPFGLDSSNTTNYGIKITSVATTGTISMSLPNDNNVTSHNDAININQQGTGAVTVTVGGTFRSTNYDGIEISQSGNGDVTVTTDGTVTGKVGGVLISTDAGTTGGVNLTTNAAVTGDAEGIKLDIDGNNAVTVLATGTVTSNTSEEAIEIEHSGTGDVNLTTSGNVTAETAAKDAIRVAHSGTGDVNITTSATVTAKNASNDAINVNHTGTGNITLTVNGSVVGGSSANAISLSTTSTSSNATIVLGTGASFTRGIDVSGVMGNANIEVGGTGDRSFDIGDTPAITGDNNFDKDGDHTLTVMGTHASGATFTQTNVNEGKLVWEGTDFRTTSLAIADGASFEITGSGAFPDTTSLTIAEGATLEITDSGAFTNASVALSGRLELTGNSSNIAVASLTGNGNVDIDVDFSGGDAELANARLTATSVTGTIPINIRSVDSGGVTTEFPEISEDDEDGAIVLENFLAVASSSAFRAGNVLNAGAFDFDIVYDSNNGSWSLVACPVGGGCIGMGIEEALYESLRAVLTQIAGLESRQQRLRGRQHAGNTAMWARGTGAAGEFEPNSASGATYETENAAAEFGIEAPIRTDNSSFSLGASVSFGDATTDVSVPGSIGEIASKSIAGAFNAGWEHRGFYADGQLQYTSFDNAIETDAKIADVDVKSYAAGVEAGYAMELGKLIGDGTVLSDTVLIPSAQVSWTSIDFDDFTDTNGTDVALGDGDVLHARAGIAFEDAWRDIAFRGHADVLMPLDGEVAVELYEAEIISEREDPAFDVGVGATYSWGGAYALSADISTQQGGGITGYAASLGFVYSFF